MIVVKVDSSIGSDVVFCRKGIFCVCSRCMMSVCDMRFLMN